MYTKFKIVVLVVFMGVFSGCASVNKMPLNEDITDIDTSQESILLGRITIQNQNKPGHQPKLLAIFINKGDEEFSFTEPTLISETEDVGKEYIFSLASEPGVVELNLMRFLRQAFLINGMADLRFSQEIIFPENEIVYIGNITATIVPREDDQPRAGSVIPLIDQSVTGFSSGTFVVEITDNFEEDIQLVTEKFPYLAGKNITKMILPEWTYPED